MKSSKNQRQQYGNQERSKGKRSEKPTKLDRKSSRGMIYENEELRLRTININAEVERGQSDIKRLRRENEHLRREIWTLRDECDRLNKRFKAKLLDHEHACSTRHSGGSGGCAGRGGYNAKNSNSNSDDSDSCDTCKCDYEECSDECCQEGAYNQSMATTSPEEVSTGSSMLTQPNVAGKYTTAPSSEAHTAFDHLSVVSEETLNNSEVMAAQNEYLLGYTPEGSHPTVRRAATPLTPLTPIEMVANQLNDLQAAVPPLSYFENILQEHMDANIDNTFSNAAATRTNKSPKHTNGWDYNLESPFAQRRQQPNSLCPATSGQQYMPQTLSTFAPKTLVSPSKVNFSVSTKTLSPHNSTNLPTIETVAITTIPVSTPPMNNSPKHFFAPLKPRLTLNTALANQNLIATAATTSPNLPTTLTTTDNNFSTTYQKCEPPDIFVANALASPYHRQAMPTTSPADPVHIAASPPARHRFSSQVSSRYRHRHQRHQQHKQQHRLQLALISVADVAANVVTNTTGNPILSTNKQYLQLQQVRPVGQQPPTAPPPPPPPPPLLHIENPSTLYTKLTEPIYATAQKRNNLISAPAVTKPLMTASTNTSQTTYTTILSKAISNTADNKIQTDSVSLDTILHDIENISEDILAIQLNKSSDNLMKKVQSSNATTTNSSPLQQSDKNKKPYRSEMNLFLSYDGLNSTITPVTATSTSQTLNSSEVANGRRTRSLEREQTNSPSPNVPEPMPPFPENRTYIGFDPVNQAVMSTSASGSTAAPNVPLKKSPTFITTVSGGSSSPSTPVKPLPPLPPPRVYTPTAVIQSVNKLRSTPEGTPQKLSGEPSPFQSPVHEGLVPNKSHLFASIAHAAVKRAQLRGIPPHLTRSFDAELTVGEKSDPSTPQSPKGENGLPQTSQSADSAKKLRNVSIACDEGTNSPSCDSSAKNLILQSILAKSPAMKANLAESCSDLATTNLASKDLSQAKSYSTPNSPHSSRRRSNSISLATKRHEVAVNASPVGATPVTTTEHSITALHHSSHISNNVGQHCRFMPDAKRNNSIDLAKPAVVTHNKCSRRHSDGTVISSSQRISSSSAAGGHHHHHHRHHQHNSSTASNNPNLGHHAHQDSNNDSATSVSDHNSNSLASSRQSSTSFSLRSQRRKISVTSHTGGKIPWCGCWGNGCL